MRRIIRDANHRREDALSKFVPIEARVVHFSMREQNTDTQQIAVQSPNGHDSLQL